MISFVVAGSSDNPELAEVRNSTDLASRSVLVEFF
jgi:hypothetical protein